jgi:hypothetical protein
MKEEVMPRSWKVLLPLLIALMLLVGAPSASAASDSRTSHYHTRDPISFTLTTACASIHSDVTGNGEIVHQISVKQYADGTVKQSVDNSFAHGSAVDSAGHTYRFFYRNRTVSEVPPAGSPIQVTMSDTFRLHSPNGGDRVNVSFLWRWTYVPQSSDVPTSTSPGIWPPQDNWVQLRTQGDPLNCDPI